MSGLRLQSKLYIRNCELINAQLSVNLINETKDRKCLDNYLLMRDLQNVPIDRI